MSDIKVIDKSGQSGAVAVNVARSQKTMDSVESIHSIQSVVQTNLISPKCKLCTASFGSSDTVADVATPDAGGVDIAVEDGIPKIVVVPYITSDQSVFPDSVIIALFDNDASDINDSPQYIGCAESSKKWHESGATCFYEPVFIENIFMSSSFYIKAALASAPGSALDVKFSVFTGEAGTYVTPVDNSFMLINPAVGESTVIERHDITITNTGTYTVTGGEMVFPGGLQSYFTIGDGGEFNFLYDGTSPYTLEFFIDPVWVNYDRVLWVGNGAYFFSIDLQYSPGGEDPASYGFYMIMNRAADDPLFLGLFFSVSSWDGEKHVAVTLDPAGTTGSFNVYIGGVNVGSKDRLASFITSSGTEKLTIGGLAVYKEAVEGTMRGLRITKEVLYTSDFTPPTEF